MNQSATNRLRSAGSLLLLLACDQNNVVGENQCIGDAISCTASPEWLDYLDERGSEPTPTFELAASRLVEPSWSLAVPGDFAAQTARAPAGTIWLYSYSMDGEHELSRIDAEGKVAAKHTRKREAFGMGNLTTGGSLSPVIGGPFFSSTAFLRLTPEDELA